MPDTLLQVGQVVRARGQEWLVIEVNASKQPVDVLSSTTLPGSTLVTLASLAERDQRKELTLVWEVEPGRKIVSATDLPAVKEGGFDHPDQLGAYLDAVGWGTVATADTTTLQAPFRSGITLETYQLEPVVRALSMPRVALLIADDVGLGKTIEAGLVVQELLLRHRARRVIVVCPASLTRKWRLEMEEKFGLDFVVLDSEELRNVRRRFGLQANPFTVYPRVIISLPWLRAPRVQRLLDEVLVDTFFDLLVVDEAHHCAPASPTTVGRPSVDTRQTVAVKRLGAHTQHRLFLSATPHNGHEQSWEALLEMLDPERFAKGAPIDPLALDQVMVRRLKADIRDENGQPKFKKRVVEDLPVTYTQAETAAHAALATYTSQGGTGRAADLITLLLKKRLFSSPAAFAHTWRAHKKVDAVTGRAPEWLDEALGWDDTYLDAAAEDEERDERDVQAEVQDDILGRLKGLTGQQLAASAELDAWCDTHEDSPDSKAKALLAYLAKEITGDERLIIFTEYRDTQVYLQNLLTSKWGSKLQLIYGGMDPEKRERVKSAFQASPDRDPVRTLLATDAASEGIDLQLHCHRVLHYDIPFNPNRLEQRNGRVDRHGQTHDVQILHFVGTGWATASKDSYEADLEFLTRVAKKLATVRDAVGSANALIAPEVEARMLGKTWTRSSVLTQTPTKQLQAERELRELPARMARLAAQVQTSIETLHVGPEHQERAVQTAFALGKVDPLNEVSPGVFDSHLAPSWAPTTTGHTDPLDPTILRPFTFTPALAGENVALAHLGHPLMQQATSLLRTAPQRGVLNAVSSVRAKIPSLDAGDLLVVTVMRLLVVAGDGMRLHEELAQSARVLPISGRSRRLEIDAPKHADVRAAIDAALSPGKGEPASIKARTRLTDLWAGDLENFEGDVRFRAEQRLNRLTADLQKSLEADLKRVDGLYDQLGKTLTRALENGDQMTIDENWLEAERRQQANDRRTWEQRRDNIGRDRAKAREVVEARYADPKPLTFPLAVLLVEQA